MDDQTNRESGDGVYVGRVLFHEYGLELREGENDSLILSVLCGGIGEYDVEFTLNHQERAEYDRDGEFFLHKIAADVRHSPSDFINRGRSR